MYHSSLPDEVNSSRPKGMLDRDLRTTLTVRIGEGVNHRNNSSECEFDNCHHSNVCTYKCLHDKQLKDADSLWTDRRLSKMRFNRKPPSFRRTKFSHCRLLFLCIWLASIYRTCAFPAMSDDLKLRADRCEAIKKALVSPNNQSDVTYGYISGLLDQYTKLQFKKNPSDHHMEWRHFQPHFVYDVKFVPNGKTFLTDDYVGEADPSQLEHINGKEIPTEEELKIEFHRIYAFLHTIKEALNKILEDHHINATRIFHDLHNDDDANKFINFVFEEQSKYNNYEINEVTTAMKALNIPEITPEMIAIQINNVHPDLGEWLTTREHLKILRYMRGVYKIFKNRCNL